MKSPLLYLITMLFLTFSMISCREVDIGEVPEVGTFERSYDLNLPSNVDLLTVNGSIVDKNVGYRGIIVYRLKSDGTGDDFVAYERACPFDAISGGGCVSWEKWGVISECDKCGSQYLLIYGGGGWPIDGKQPSNMPLKQYETYFDGRYVIVSH